MTKMIKVNFFLQFDKRDWNFELIMSKKLEFCSDGPGSLRFSNVPAFIGFFLENCLRFCFFYEMSWIRMKKMVTLLNSLVITWEQICLKVTSRVSEICFSVFLHFGLLFLNRCNSKISFSFKLKNIHKAFKESIANFIWLIFVWGNQTFLRKKQRKTGDLFFLFFSYNFLILKKGN